MLQKLFWIPRILTILFILFLSMFALDVFSMEGSFLNKLGGFLIHLIPSYILIGILVLAWKKPFVGGCVFIFLGLLFTFYFRTYQHLLNFVILSCPLYLVGILYLVFYYTSRRKTDIAIQKNEEDGVNQK